MHFVKISDIRASQDLSKANIPYVMRFVFVPLAWPVTSIFASLGISPNMATTFRFGLILLSAGFIVSDEHTIFIWGVALFLLSVVFDSVDGNLSRIQNKASFYGKYFDGITDMFGELLFHAALIFHFRAETLFVESAAFMSLMGMLSLGVLYILVHRLPLFASSLPLAIKNAAPAHPGLARFLENNPIGKMVMTFDCRSFSILFDLKYVVFVYFIIYGYLSEFIIIMNYIYAVFVVLFFLSRTLKAYVTLDHHKISQSASTGE